MTDDLNVTVHDGGDDTALPVADASDKSKTDDCVSRKLDKLMNDEKMPHKQALAVAISMCEEEHKEVESPDAAEPTPDAASEKHVVRLSQIEAQYTPLSPFDDKACANCRFFDAANGGLCLIVHNYPDDILPTGYCVRHELAPAMASEQVLASAEHAEPETDDAPDEIPVLTPPPLPDFRQTDPQNAGAFVGLAGQSQMLSASAEFDTFDGFPDSEAHQRYDAATVTQEAAFTPSERRLDGFDDGFPDEDTKEDGTPVVDPLAGFDDGFPTESKSAGGTFDDGFPKTTPVTAVDNAGVAESWSATVMVNKDGDATVIPDGAVAVFEVKESAPAPIDSVLKPPSKSDWWFEITPTTVTVADAKGKSLKQVVMERLEQIFGRKDAEPETSGFKAYDNGRWVAWWTNNFEDREGEIITAKAIDDYIARVDAGIVPFPELRTWHIPGSNYGTADWLGRIGHFAVASGTFDDTDKGRAAQKHFAKTRRRYQMSHGFYYPVSAKEGKVYHRINTFEISDIPPKAKRFAAANPYTDFSGAMDMLTKEKRDELVLKFGEEIAESIIQHTEGKSKAVAALGERYKDFTAPADAEANAESVEIDLKQLIADVIGENAQLAQYQLAAAQQFVSEKQAKDETIQTLTTALATQKTEFEAAIKALKDELAAVKEIVDAAPRQASEDKATDLEHLVEIAEAAAAQKKRVDSFTGLEIPA